MPVNLSPDNLIFKHFVVETDGDSNDYSNARKLAGSEGIDLLKQVVSAGYSVSDVLMTLYHVYDTIGVASRQWVKDMLDFVKSFKPDFESAKNRFAPNGQQSDIKIGYDDTLKLCVAYIEYLVTDAATALVPGLSVNDLLDAEKLTKLRDLYNGKETTEALKKLKAGDKLNLTDREKLQALFSMAPEVMETLSASFSDLGGNGGTSSVLISEESLSAMATRATNKLTRRQDELVEMIRTLFNSALYLR